MTTSLPPHELIDQLVCGLNRLAQKGWRGFECSAKNLAIANGWEGDRNQSATADSLSRIRSDLHQCQRCTLSKSRTQIVFGSGNAEADLLFVGDRLEPEDDKNGEPFTGSAGQLLTRIIAAMGLNREDVYLCNIVKCCPPKDRWPFKAEIEACHPYLKRQIATIAPKVICSLGDLATRVLLNSDQSFDQMRGHFHDLDGINVMPTFHPYELLRHPQKKRGTWDDIQKIMHILNLPLG